MAVHDFSSERDFMRNACNYDYCRYVDKETLVKASIEGAIVLIMDNKRRTIISYKGNIGRFNINFVLKDGEMRDEYRNIVNLDQINEFVNMLLGIYHECKCPITHNPLQHGFLISNNGEGYKVEMVNIKEQ